MTNAALSPAAPEAVQRGSARPPASTTSLRERLEAVEIAHRDGLVTERIAAAEHTQSGQRETNVARVVRAVREHPGATALELVPPSGLDRYEVSRRLADARRLGYVRSGAPVIREHLRPQVEWFPTEAQAVLL